LATLDRGYAIVFPAKSNIAVRDASQLVADEHLEIRFARGQALVRVEKIEPGC
jgi:exonuclease VII large subunit